MTAKYLKMLLLLTGIGLAQTAYCQTDTLKLSIKDAEKLFLQNNLILLAQKYNVDASKALIQQAGLWDNPVLSTEQNITDNTGKFFNHTSNNGQIFVQLSQLIQTAGKRGKQVKVATADANIQQAAFNDVMRNLRYNLLLDIAQTANLIDQAEVYRTEIASATNLVNAVDASYKAGNSSLKDVIRLKALLFALQNELVDNERQLNTLQSELKTLLGAQPNQFISPKIDFSTAAAIPDAATLAEQAKVNRGDFLVSQYTYDQAKDNLALQKALSVPDVTVGAVYDQRSNYADNYVGLQISVPLPFFNRNQGNIKSAKLAVQSQQYTLQNSELQLKNDVYSAVNQYQLSQQLLNKNELDFYDRYDQLYNSMLKSFKQRQIGLQEFIDFFDSYKETKIKILQQQLNLQKAIADINYAVGTTVINPL